MNGWKVLQNSRCSFNSDDNQDGTRLYYPVGVPVYPEIKNSFLFFFRNKFDAENFVSRWGRYESAHIVPCIAHDCRKAKYMSIGQEYRFWKMRSNKRKFFAFTEFVPKGTWFAKSITCLE